MSMLSANAILTECDVRRWELLSDLQRHLELCAPQNAPGAPTDAAKDGIRYLSLVLFGTFDSAIRSMADVGARRPHGRRYSAPPLDPVNAIDFEGLSNPYSLGKLLDGLATDTAGWRRNPRHALWVLQNERLWELLPSAAWPSWGIANRLGTSGGLASLPEIHLLDDIRLNAGRSRNHERGRNGDLYVGDNPANERCCDPLALAELSRNGCHFIARVRDEALMDFQDPLPMTASDFAAGVIWHRLGQLGPGFAGTGPMRVAWLQTGEEVLALATNFSPVTIPAAVLGRIYMRRRQIKLVARWIQCIRACRIQLVESPPGAAVAVYLALIGALLARIYLGRRPDSGMMGLLQLYFLGVATVDDVIRAMESKQN